MTLRVRGLTGTIQRWHVYAGLFSALALLLFGVSGLVATWRPGVVTVTSSSVRIDPAPGATDEALVEQVRQLVKPPLAAPAPGWAIRRDSSQQIVTAFYSVNAITRLTLDPSTGTARLQEEQLPLGVYLMHMHAVTTLGQLRDGHPLLMIWSLYIEASVFALLFFCASSVYLWLATRRRSVPAAVAFAAGVALFILMYGQVIR